jgi:hypothetical protein
MIAPALLTQWLWPPAVESTEGEAERECAVYELLITKDSDYDIRDEDLRRQVRAERKERLYEDAKASSNPQFVAFLERAMRRCEGVGP